MRKRFIHLAATPHFTGAYVPAPCRPMPYCFTNRSYISTLFDVWVRRAKHRVCCLAHWVLSRWGRPVYFPEEKVETIELPTAENVISGIQDELINRVQSYNVRPENLAIICGHSFRAEIDRVMFENREYRGTQHAYHWQFENRLFGMAVVVTPWLEEGEFVLLPVDYIKGLAAAGVLERRVATTFEQDVASRRRRDRNIKNAVDNQQFV